LHLGSEKESLTWQESGKLKLYFFFANNSMEPTKQSIWNLKLKTSWFANKFAASFKSKIPHEKAI